ncbi:hybrid sensor histidine kinase/response regulator [Hyalangium rubrum]|uniref:histidine kinase n=1 Tax=Hyalangium rubrum TaxID=3103134 RepID=A0ABU5GZ43_9BACT|nr:hybrid sensor histidine kinase/response regulator [Hyalangium sp. s54d21]MDY7225100.1 hybrid sensor histidine kinase/response regulator [Hyalangium sp. s54d21]
MNVLGQTGERLQSKATILNVNDHPATLYLVSQTLRLAGYQVLEASTGREGMAIAAGKPDLVLLDVHLPDLDGYEVCRRLRAQEETSGLLIAHLSAVSVQREDRIRGLAYGADAYWTTPIEDEELLANIEALLRLQRRAQEAIRVRDDFLSIAAHELKTPLTALRLNLERALYLTARGTGDTLPKATIDKALKPAVRQLDRMRQLLDALLDVSRLSRQRLNLEVGTVELMDLARDVALRLEPHARASGVELVLEAPREPVVLFGDRLRLEQVLNNLLTNAIKYGGGKPVRLRVEEQADMAALTVQDQGIGIAPEDQARIFGRFERATSTRQSDSLGLGLYIAKEIITAHGGSITVMSELGHGTTFQVNLPLRRTERY